MTIPEEKYLVPIGRAASVLGVSISTLRRWDESGQLRAVRKSPDGNRFYRQEDLDFFPNDLFQGAFNWASAPADDIPETPSHLYLATKAQLQTRLEKLERQLQNVPDTASIFPLVVSVTGEIGVNSFDHNLGRWPDAQGIFFACHTESKEIVIADRGLGVLATLSKVRPGLASHQEALHVAFTDYISGRTLVTSEARGNGLKYVRQVVSKNLISLRFQSGDAELEIKRDSSELNLRRATQPIRGCIAFIKF